MRKDILNLIKETTWRTDWSGPFSLLEVSTSQRIYFNGMKNCFGKSFSHFLVIYKNGIVSDYLPEKEYLELGEYLGKKMMRRETAKKAASNFVELADEINKVIALSPRKFLEGLELNVKLYENYGAHNVAIKMTVDVAGEYMTNEVKEILAESRRYSETFYKNNAKAFIKATEFMAKEAGYKQEQVFMMTRKELVDYLDNKKMPPRKTLDSRYKHCGIYSDQEKQIILSAEEAGEVEKHWTKEKSDILSGVSAYPGKVKGRCRVIMDYRNVSFKEGEILVTGMTDPDYISLMKKSAAIVTDGGGILSHAAIVARELKKPCVIGTKIATQVLKDGDLVEVDADKGVVKILNKTRN